MLSLGIRYLRGVAVGSHGELGRIEWPPHPARVFMAMVAAHYQTGADAAEREALEWLEQQAAPEIHAPEADECRVVTQYVPVNDDPSQHVVKQGKVTLYQEISGTSFRRNRQDRVFARASLANDSVILHWPAAEPQKPVRDALAALCGKVTRIGHSSSLVQMWITDSIPEGLHCWLEDENHGTHQLRVTREGTLKAVLDASYNGEAVARYCEILLATEDATTPEAKSAAKKAMKEAFPHGEPRRDRPHISTYASYAKAEEVINESPAKGSVFDPCLSIFTIERVDGPFRSLDLACTLVLSDRWREALASYASDLLPEAQSLITGHAPDKSPLQTVHVAYLALGFVGHPHASGHVPGIALAFPDNMPPDIRRDVLRAVGRVRELKLGPLGAWRLAPSAMPRPLETLRPATWTAHPGGATQWSTITPIAYDHHPKAKDKTEYMAQVSEMISAGCERICLRPRTVIPTSVSAHLGAPPSHAFPRLLRKDGSERRHTHAILVFDEPVRGPIIIGAGRYRGYGLCRPMEVGK